MIMVQQLKNKLLQRILCRTIVVHVYKECTFTCSSINLILISHKVLKF